MGFLLKNLPNNFYEAEYFFINGNILTIKTYDNSEIEKDLVFNTQLDATISIRNFLNAGNWKHFSAFGESNGRTYFINTKLLTKDAATSEVTHKIKFQFPDCSLNFYSPNSILAQNNVDIANGIKYNNFLADFLTGSSTAVVHRVNPSYTTSTALRQYNHIKLAIDNASSGEFVYVENANHSITSCIILKNGVNIYAQENASISGSLNTALFSTTAASTTSGVYGYANFLNSHTAISSHIFKSASYSKTFFSFKNLSYSGDFTAFYSVSGDTIVKGLNANSKKRIFDNDDMAGKFDGDIMSVTCLENFFFPDANINANNCFRNSLISITGIAPFYLGENATNGSSANENSFVNIIVRGSYDNVIETIILSEPTNFRIWNTFFEAGTNYTVYDSDVNEFYVYGKNYWENTAGFLNSNIHVISDIITTGSLTALNIIT